MPIYLFYVYAYLTITYICMHMLICIYNMYVFMSVLDVCVFRNV